MNGLFDAIGAADWIYKIGEVSEMLEGADVLVFTTRHSYGGYSVDELSAIIDFVHRGGGLWCMANHAAYSMSEEEEEVEKNFVRYESAVSTTFFTAFEAAGYQAETEGEATPIPTLLEGANLDINHPILLDVESVVTIGFCGIYPNFFTDTLVHLQGLDDVTNQQSGRAVSDGVVWAVAIDHPDVTKLGRVVICADSGWIGDPSSNPEHPSGMFQEGDNTQFALNTLAWLGQLDAG